MTGESQITPDPGFEVRPPNRTFRGVIFHFATPYKLTHSRIRKIFRQCKNRPLLIYRTQGQNESQEDTQI